MPKRIRCAIKWDDDRKKMRAYDETTGEPLTNYGLLLYGDTEDAKEGRADDAEEAAKSFEHQDAVGWVTVEGENG